MLHPRRVPRARLDKSALRIARIPFDAPVLLRASAWDSDVELPEEAPDDPEMIADDVALVTVEGPLSREADTACGWYDGYWGEDGIVARFERAILSSEVRAVVLYFRSPGGTSAGLDEAVREMIRIRDATGKAVIGWFEECCSAAFWIATAVCDAGLYLGETGEAGSIGSYVTHWEESAALEKDGIKPTLIADPPGKVAGNLYEPLSDLARARIERGVKACTGRFFSIVTTTRGLTEKQLRELDGDVLEGVDAVTAGLADGVADLATTVSLVQAIADERAAAAEEAEAS